MMPSTLDAHDAIAHERVMGRWSRCLAEPLTAAVLTFDEAAVLIEIKVGGVRNAHAPGLLHAIEATGPAM